jgi:arylformamidase
MKPIFLSYFLDENTPIYGGIPDTISFSSITSISEGDTANSLKIDFPNHVGTHVDFPFHFDNNGKNSSDYSADFWVFEKVGLLNCSIEEVPVKLRHLPSDIELLILKTGFGEKRYEEVYWKSQPIIPASYAKLFRSFFPNLRVFGFDLISLTSKLDRSEGKKAHLAFLIEEDILILEDMKLDELDVTPNKVIISPLQLKSVDGTPCTVISF